MGVGLEGDVFWGTLKKVVASLDKVPQKLARHIRLLPCDNTTVIGGCVIETVSMIV